jgi:hypothetical protein
MVAGREDRWHPIMNIGDQLISVGRDNCKGPDPVTGRRVGLIGIVRDWLLPLNHEPVITIFGEPRAGASGRVSSRG